MFLSFPFDGQDGTRIRAKNAALRLALVKHRTWAEFGGGGCRGRRRTGWNWHLRHHLRHPPAHIVDICVDAGKAGLGASVKVFGTPLVDSGELDPPVDVADQRRSFIPNRVRNRCLAFFELTNQNAVI